jgi:hypothetical protein
VKAFLMGENRWIDLDDWPVPDAVTQSWYLSWEDKGGQLALETTHGSNARSYVYDPRDPVPTRGGPIYWGFEFVGPVDQRPLLNRDDLLVYRSRELTSPMAVIGPIELDLFISSDVEDTDFIARLCVQESSGAITCLALGSLRCRYRDSWSDPTPLTPGNITPIHLQMGHTAYVFPAGSRICLLITSSDFPRIQPHPNTMASPFSETRSIPALNSILHGDTTPSCLKLPIVSI